MKTATKRRLTTEERQAMQAEALDRATGGQSLANWPAIIEGFTAKGIPAADILPRENVLTFNAWRARGRYVRRGEHGVKVLTFIKTATGDRSDGPGEERRDQRRGGSRPWTATVFHVSQTDPIDPVPSPADRPRQPTPVPVPGFHNPDTCDCLVCRAIRGE